MKPLKERTINHIIEIEGGYVNDPDDSGGETNFGITIAVARAWEYHGAMIDLPREIAFDIYESLFWNALKLDQISTISESVAAEIVDTAINMGQARATTFLQRALNVFNQKGDLYPDIVVDGALGNATINALKSYFQTRNRDGETILVNALNCLQGAKYISLAETREKDEEYVFGWMRQRVSII
jgi:lysozyme family protein